MQVYATGEGGNGGNSIHGTSSGGGGGGGALGGETSLGGLTGGSTTLTITIGTGGTSTDTTVTGGSVTVTGAHGTNASSATPGNGGAAGSNTVAEAGGNGANGTGGSAANGSGGGGSAGSTGAGGTASLATGGTAGTGAAGPPSLAGAAGASGAGSNSAGANGTAPGSGASGGGSAGGVLHAGGTGAPGQVVIIWSVYTYGPAGIGTGTGTFTSTTARSGGFKGYATGTLLPPARPVNQWAATSAQPATFGPMPPALQSVVVPLDPASSVGSGSGVPSQGNWLFCVVTSNQDDPLPSVTFADGDDIHSYWRAIPTSPSAGNTRTSVWYTANLARSPSYVYVAPNGMCGGIAATVVEVAGLGPWDTVTAFYGGYANAATSLNLALAAPSAAAFLIAAAGGDSDAVSQSFSPAGWTSLATVTATNGTDHTCDAVLTSACLVTSSAVSVNATTGSASDLSGVILGVLVSSRTKADTACSVLNKKWG